MCWELQKNDPYLVDYFIAHLQSQILICLKIKYAPGQLCRQFTFPLGNIYCVRTRLRYKKYIFGKPGSFLVKILKAQ